MSVLGCRLANHYAIMPCGAMLIAYRVYLTNWETGVLSGAMMVT